MTIKKKHPIVKKGLQEIRQALLCDGKHPFEIYFVVPKEVGEDHTVPQSYLGTHQQVLTVPQAIPRNIQQYVLPLNLKLFKGLDE